MMDNQFAQEHQALEQEAFRLQSQLDAEALIIAALNRRCSNPSDYSRGWTVRGGKWVEGRELKQRS